jgi:hypothetical protein
MCARSRPARGWAPGFAPTVSDNEGSAVLPAKPAKEGLVPATATARTATARTGSTTRRAALIAVSALARDHANALAHYEAGADEDEVFWAAAKQILDEVGVDLLVVANRLRAIVDARHEPGTRTGHCVLCRTLNTERRALEQRFADRP